MAFVAANLKEVGGPGNEHSGGQTYSLWSDTDTLATMLASGYFNDLSFKLRVRDILFLTGTDGAVMAQVEGITTANVVTTSVSLATGSGIQALSGAGAANITDLVTAVTSTGTDAVTLADGGIGQIKIISLIVDGGTMTLTPATALGYTTIVFANVGDTVTLMWLDALGWAIMGQSVRLTAGSGVQALSGPGAANLTDTLTAVTSTGADAVTLANGTVGQIKIICLVVDSGTMTLTPATASGYTTIVFADAGDTVTLLWVGVTGWAIIGQGGLTTGPLSA